MQIFLFRFLFIYRCPTRWFIMEQYGSVRDNGERIGGNGEINAEGDGGEGQN